MLRSVEDGVQTDSSLKILESGVDWLTVTAPRGQLADAMIAQCDPLLHQQEALGNRILLWKGSGYHGRTSGAVSLGVGKQGSIVTLKSREAFLSAATFLGGDYRVTRLDLQTTCFDERQMAARAEVEFALVQSRPKTAGRPISAHIRIDSRGGQSLYLGSPKSDIIARLYDKGIEKKIAPAGACWRWEVQYRRRVAKLQAARLYQSKNPAVHIASTVTSFFKTRGVTVPRVAKVAPEYNAEYEALYSTRAETDDARSLRWLSTYVASTVRRLIESGKREEVMRSLGLADHVVNDDDSLTVH